ncbi:MAG: 1-aminocyclopropane-1-carboxylate deaminase/D-cysteine desulfhydrase, partial [Pseudomonadales bacterium]
NHIHALAYAAHAAQIPCTGFIRGQWRDDNPTLADARRWSMELIALDRARYREKHTPAFIAELEARYPGAVIIPEGGSSAFAVRGAGELMQQISAQSEVDYLLCACGTGGTLAGLISAAPDHLKLIGVPVLKGGDFLKTDIQALLHSAGASGTASWSLDLNGHYGGYAKVKAEHIAHMQRIEQRHGLLLDPVYTAKLWRRFDELVEEGAFAPGSRIALLHSGGLQGRRGFGL